MNLTDLFKLNTLIKFANDARATGNQSAYHDIIDRLGRSPMNSLATSGASISGYVSDIQAIVKDVQRIVSSDASWSYKMSIVAELLNSIQIGEDYLKTDDLTLSELAHGITHPADLMSPDYQGFSKYVVVSNVNKIPNRARLSNIVSGTARIASMPATASDYQSIVNDIGGLDASNVDDQARVLNQLASDTGKLARSAGPSLANGMGLSSVAVAAAGQATALPIDNKLNSLGVDTKFRDVINRASANGHYSLLSRVASYAERDFSSAANAGTFINSFVNDLHSVKGSTATSVGVKLNNVAHDSAVSNFYRIAKSNSSSTDDILSNLADFSASHAAYNLNNVSHDIMANASFTGIDVLNRIAANASSQADVITKADAKDDLVNHEVPALFSDIIDQIASSQLDRPIFSSFIGDVKRRLSDYVLDFNGLFGFIPDFKKALSHAGYNGRRASRLVADLIRLASDPDLKSAYGVVRSRPLSEYMKAVLDDLSEMTSANEASKLNDIASIAKAHFANNATLRRCGYSGLIGSLAANASSTAADLSRSQSIADDKAYGSFLNHDLDSLVSSGIAAVSRPGFDHADFRILVSNAEGDLSSANAADFVNKLATQAGAFNGATTMNIKNGLGSLADNPKLNEAYQSMSNNSKATDSILNDLSGMTSDNRADKLNDIASVAGDNFSNASMFGSFAADTSSIAANGARSSLANSFVDTLVADVNGGSLNKVTNDLSEIDHDPKYRAVRTSPNVVKEVRVARGAVKTMARTAIDSMIINVLGSNPVESLGVLRHAVKNLTNRDLQATFNGQLNAIKADLLNNNKNNEVNFKTQLIGFVANVKGEEVPRLSADGAAALERIYNYIEAPVHARFKTVLMTKIIPLLLDIANRRLDSNGANDHVKNDLNEIYGTVRFYNATALNSFLNVIYSHARDYGQTPASVSSVAGLVPQIVGTVTRPDFDRVHFDQAMETIKNNLETNRSLSDLWSHVKATLGVRTFIRRHGDLSGIITGILNISSSTLKALNAAYVEGHTDENVKKILTDLEIIANNSKDPNGDSTAAKNHAVKHALNDIHNRLNDETLKQIDGVAGHYGLDRAVIKAKDDYNPRISVPRRAKKPVSSSVSSASNRAAAASESSSSSSSKPKDSRAVASAFAKANADHYLKLTDSDTSTRDFNTNKKSNYSVQNKLISDHSKEASANLPIDNKSADVILIHIMNPHFDKKDFISSIDIVKNALISQNSLDDFWNVIKHKKPIKKFIDRHGKLTNYIVKIMNSVTSFNDIYRVAHQDFININHILKDLADVACSPLDSDGKSDRIDKDLNDIAKIIFNDAKLEAIHGLKTLTYNIRNNALKYRQDKSSDVANVVGSSLPNSVSKSSESSVVVSKSSARSHIPSENIKLGINNSKSKAVESSNADESLISNYVALNSVRQVAFSANGAGFSNGIGISEIASQAESAAQYAFNAVNSLSNNSVANSARNDANKANLNAASAQREESMIQHQQFQASRDCKRANSTDDLSSAQNYASDAKAASRRVAIAASNIAKDRDLAIKAARNAEKDAEDTKSNRSKSIVAISSANTSSIVSSASYMTLVSQTDQSHNNSSNDSYYASLSNSVKSASISVGAAISSENSYERSRSASEASASTTSLSIMSLEAAAIQRDRQLISGDSSQIANNLNNSNVQNDPEISSNANYDRQLMSQLTNGVNVDALSPNSSTTDNARKAAVLAASITNDTYKLLNSANISSASVASTSQLFSHQNNNFYINNRSYSSRFNAILNNNERKNNVRSMDIDLHSPGSIDKFDHRSNVNNQTQGSHYYQSNKSAVATELISAGALLRMVGRALNDKRRNLK